MARKAQNKPQEKVESVPPDEAIQATQPVSSAEQVAAVSVSTPLSACGGALRAAREKQKLSVQDVASQLRLGIKQVEALESDRYDKLPQPSIVRGFIRNYAKLLKVDAAPILDAYSTLVPNTAPQSFAVKSNANASVIGENRANFSFKSFIGLLFTFALVVCFFYYYTQVIKPNVATDLSNINAPAVESDAHPENSSEFALPAAERQADAATSIELPTPESNITNAPPPSAEGAASSTTGTSPTAEPTLPTTATPTTQAPSSINVIAAPAVKPSITPAPAALPAPAEPNTSQPAPEIKRTQLVIDATEETWVNVTDASGKQVYSKVLAGGTSETITATPPLSITVGNAQATSISVNGKPLDLLAHTRDKVARIKVN